MVNTHTNIQRGTHSHHSLQQAPVTLLHCCPRPILGSPHSHAHTDNPALEWVWSRDRAPSTTNPMPLPLANRTGLNLPASLLVAGQASFQTWNALKEKDLKNYLVVLCYDKELFKLGKNLQNAHFGMNKGNVLFRDEIKNLKGASALYCKYYYDEK